MTTSLNAKELTDIMDKQWATTKDIQRIGCCGINKAQRIKKEIRNQMLDAGMFIPRYLVDMEYVIKYFHINEKRMRKLSRNGGVTNG